MPSNHRNITSSIMARTCVMAAICASLRKSTTGIRSVSAFAFAPSTTNAATKRVATNHRALFMSTETETPASTIVPRMKAADATEPTDHPVVVKGWVRTVRKQKTLAFVEVNDGSNLGGIQTVLPFDAIDEDTKKAIDKLTTGAAVAVEGPLVKSQGGKQAVELAGTSLKIIGDCPGDTYPLAKKRHSLEYLRTIAHLRPRTNTVAAVARVRSVLAGAVHSFFQQSGFVYVQTPLITASDCEGAGELFRVTTLDLDKVSELPKAVDEESGKETDSVDYAEDFFGKPAYLTVSGQLGAETHACALGDVYTFGPTFRAENSQTTRHLAEFHMVEPEMAFADLDSAMDNAEAMLKHVVKDVLGKCSSDLEFFQKFYDKGLTSRLEKVVSQPFVRVSYRDAIGFLQEEIAKDPSKWQFPDVEFGTDLATEHERWLAETKFDSAVFVYNYPKSIKAFYMRDNDEDGGETVNAMDLLVPGVGELVGGSQREERLDVLEAKLAEQDLNPEDYWWYLDLRRFGSVPHAGYGLGFERLVTYVCGIENIREAIAFPRYPGNAEF
mmetsp:Transcript_8553/g.12210  ORF Transcript_8553/g.12210 Transcript_8553/m.12210 type:complete len:554 (-) Transcript_8553:138-1799(-)